MYTFAPTSQARRSAQTVLWQITEALTRLVAPILSFTADEVWEYLPAVEGREASVHLAQFPSRKKSTPKTPLRCSKSGSSSSSYVMRLLVLLENERRQSRSARVLRRN